MTLFGADKEINFSGFSPSFIVQGQVNHNVGSLLPSANGPYKFLQIYFMGNNNNYINRRYLLFTNVKRGTIMK